jgi:uncharacterized protein DUF6869
VSKQQTDISQKAIVTLATDWVHYHRLPKKEQENSPYFRAFERLYELVRDEPEHAWPVIGEIRKIDASDAMLANLAAGPVEDFLVHHGGQFIERIEALAKNDPVFRKMLGVVWKNRIAEDVWGRLKQIAGPTF